MEGYCWEPQGMSEVVVLPAAVVDQHLKMAGPLQLKVLLWLCRAGKGQFDAEACAAAVGKPPAACREAMQYWVEAGLLRLTGSDGTPAPDLPSSAKPEGALDRPTYVVPVFSGAALAAGQAGPGARSVLSAPSSSPTDDTAPQTPPEILPLPVLSGASAQHKEAPSIGQAAASASFVGKLPACPGPRPRAVKPQMDEVIARREESKDVAYLFDTVAARFGRPLSPGDLETLLYLHDTAGLPVEVILMVVGYAAEQNKLTMRYVEATALGWADEGILTIAAAEQYLCQLEQKRSCWAQLCALLDIQQKPTANQLAAAKRWLADWKMDGGLIRLAYRQCLERTGKLQATYMDKILEHWRLDGITSPDQVASRPARRAVPKETSLDLDDYESRVLQHVPVYHQKEG